MRNWSHRVSVKHLFTQKEDFKSIKSSMEKVADELKKHKCFENFDTSLFYKIPKSTSFQTSVEAANTLISRMYDFADSNRIWID